MAKKKPNDHGTGIHFREVEALVRILLPQIQAFLESEVGQKEFAEWKYKRVQEVLKFRDFVCTGTLISW